MFSWKSVSWVGESNHKMGWVLDRGPFVKDVALSRREIVILTLVESTSEVERQESSQL